MGLRMRFRTDSYYWADMKARGTDAHGVGGYTAKDLADFDEGPAAARGDVWRIRWYREDGNGPLAGYAICCPKCGFVHVFTTAGNCEVGRHEVKYQGNDGKEHSYYSCQHYETGSCWVWTGSAEDNTLSAAPSLAITVGCLWHGWLENGEFRDA